ncbi:MAG: hypothetical protein Q8O78_05665, partial [Candidatus Deferrimicrobium sp.]|nr:hypothetical protein [Candidatus Deferrimicrobium sp.]
VEVARLVGLRNVFEGRVLSHHRDRGTTVLEWNGRRLDVRLQEAFPAGARVAWVLPSAGVLLMPRDRTSEGIRDNIVEGTVGKMVTLGNRVRVPVRVQGANEALLATTVPRHLAESYALAEGRPLSLRLRGEQIHLMPPDDDPRDPAGR